MDDPPIDSCLIEALLLLLFVVCKLDELVVEFGVQLDGGGNGIVEHGFNPLLDDDNDVINEPGKRPGVVDDVGVVPVIDWIPFGFNDPVDNANNPAVAEFDGAAIPAADNTAAAAAVVEPAGKPECNAAACCAKLVGPIPVIALDVNDDDPGPFGCDAAAAGIPCCCCCCCCERICSNC